MGRLAIVMLLVTASVAVAQPKPEGTRLFEEGRDLAKAGKYDLACEKFQQSLAIDRAPGTFLNYGDCLEHLGQLRRAFLTYDEAARAFERDKDPRAKFARERADAVVPRLGTVIVKIAEPTAPGLIVEIGGQSVPPQAEITERFDPGDIAVTARIPGQTPFVSSARAVAGATVILEIPAFGAPLGTSPSSAEPVTGGRNRGRVMLAIGLGAGGGVLLGISGLLGLNANQLYDDTAASASCSRNSGKLVCTPEAAAEIDRAGKRADLATGAAIIGGLAVVGAVVVYLTAPRETLMVSPTASASAVGVTLSGRF
jgi:tetratricopeptide (TPR) repeat protein